MIDAYSDRHALFLHPRDIGVLCMTSGVDLKDVRRVTHGYVLLVKVRRADASDGTR